MVDRHWRPAEGLWYLGPVRSTMLRIPIALAATLAVFTVTEAARADSSAWAFAGAGAFGWKQGDDKVFKTQAALSFDVGVGTSPDAAVIFGGLVRATPLLPEGTTDFGFLARAATHGFQAGGFGAALEAGTYLRTWSGGLFGFSGGLTLGAPLGITVSVQTGIGPDRALALGGVLGFDFLRLTVYRQNQLDYWPNPLPAQEVPPPKKRRQSAFGGLFRF